MMASMDADGLKRVAATLIRLERPADRRAAQRLLHDRLGAYLDGSEELAALLRTLWRKAGGGRRGAR
ncbi:MAG: hypothetical protein KatS3mg119_1253 [Rhodothalassiaceae bacterium]|nr:MAG: hypothetical protein KatS3mg119_1253 [Rhodothalassiaceae bacterium]